MSYRDDIVTLDALLSSQVNFFKEESFKNKMVKFLPEEAQGIINRRFEKNETD